MATYRYSAFGEEQITGNALSPWRYSRKRVDPETGFLYFGKRYYDPTTFCWLTTDPIEDSDGPNLYAYVHNNPLYYTDPDGRFAFVVAFAIPLGWGALEAALASLTLKAVVATAFGTALGVAVYQGTHQLDICLNKSEDEQKRKQRNKPPQADPKAEGNPHTIIERPGKDGQYTTHNGDGTYKQYRGSGKSHGNIPRPNVKENKINYLPDGSKRIGNIDVRPPMPHEIPK